MRRGHHAVTAVVERLEQRRLLAFGDVDASFGAGGFVQTKFRDRPGGVRQLFTMSDGRIVAVGEPGIARYLPDGAPDTSFSNDGKVYANGGAIVAAQLDDDDGSVVALQRVGEADYVLARYRADGTLDESFGGDGHADVGARSPFAFASGAVAIDDGGRIVVAYTDEIEVGGGVDHVVLKRFSAAGVPDGSFGLAGAATVQLGAPPPPESTDDRRHLVSDLRVLDDGRIVLAGRSYREATIVDPLLGHIETFYDGQVVAAARFAEGGTLDEGYGMAGVARAEYRDPDNPYPVAAHVEADGSVLFAVGPHFQTAAGTIDTTGATTFAQHVDAPMNLGLVYAVRRRPDGRAVLLGSDDFRRVFLGITDARGRLERRVDTHVAGFDGPALHVLPDGRALVGGSILPNERAFRVGRIDLGQPGEPRPDEFENAADNDLAFGADRVLHLAYYDVSSHSLKYARRGTDLRWSAPVEVDPGAADVGRFASLAVDRRNQPAVAYYDATNGDLKYAERIDGTWRTTVIDAAGDTGLRPDLKFNRKGRPIVAYHDASRGDLRFAVRDGGAWAVETIDATGDTGRWPSLAEETRAGRWSVAYARADDNRLLFAARRADHTWKATAIDRTRGGVAHVALGFFGSGAYGPTVTYHDVRRALLKVARDVGTGWHVKDFTHVGVEGLYPRLFARNDAETATLYSWNARRDRVVRHTLSTIVEHEAANEFPLPPGGGEHLSVAVIDDPRVTMVAYIDSATDRLFLREI